MIGDEIEALGVSISDAAKALGVTRQQLHNLISRRSGITPEMAVRLEMAIGGGADTWVRLQTNYDLAQIRTALPRSRSRNWRDPKSLERSRRDNGGIATRPALQQLEAAAGRLLEAGDERRPVAWRQ